MQDFNATLYSPLLMQIVDYCESSSCRRKKYFESFGEKVQPTLCQRSCDACKHPNLVSSCLEELRRVPNCHYNKISPVFKSSLVNPEHMDTEFWNCEDEASISAEDISDSDDGKEIVSNIAISKIGPKAGLDAKFKALERAESAYYQAKGQTKQQGDSLVDKKIISQALRDACRKRLLDALGQAKLHLGNLLCDTEAAATHLETECFKKYEEVGKTFYNSQIAATVRWLSSATFNQVQNRLCALLDQTTDHGAPSSTSFVPESPPAAPEVSIKRPGEASSNEATQTIHTDEFGKRKHAEDLTVHAASTENVELPPIPSFREFMSQKRRDGSTSSHFKAWSRASGLRRKSSVVIEKQDTNKRMKS